MKFASEEIMTKAVYAYLEGKATARQLADILGYTPATICNWVRAYRENKRLSPKPNEHRKSCFSPEEIRELQALLDKNVDITLQEIKEHFNKSCCLAAIHRMLVKLGYRYKKKLSRSANAQLMNCTKQLKRRRDVSLKKTQKDGLNPVGM